MPLRPGQRARRKAAGVVPLLSMLVFYFFSAKVRHSQPVGLGMGAHPAGIRSQERPWPPLSASVVAKDTRTVTAAATGHSSSQQHADD